MKTRVTASSNESTQQVLCGETDGSGASALGPYRFSDNMLSENGSRPPAVTLRFRR